MSLQQIVSGPGEASSLLDIMSSSAMSTGSNSSLRNVTVKKVCIQGFREEFFKGGGGGGDICNMDYMYI